MTVRPRRNSSAYVPLDELLDTLIVRILRALTHFAHASADDLHDALELGDDDKRTCNAVSTNLRRLAASGAIARDGERGEYLYAITEKGRADLAAMLKRAEIGIDADDEGAIL